MAVVVMKWLHMEQNMLRRQAMRRLSTERQLQHMAQTHTALRLRAVTMPRAGWHAFGPTFG
ncbi:hypothetical protein GCM10007423_55070 [Dyadobacter endophyticus]|uniref:Uncharacterized protein n=1 Tax=Dyadobacter endophyticus TaxID=1749036 RepID=A0ABQ1Z5W3_9BACT|nr:hypothetical protein GCM10007423_55070 [Dyadobacter endophyticus]